MLRHFKHHNIPIVTCHPEKHIVVDHLFPQKMIMLVLVFLSLGFPQPLAFHPLKIVEKCKKNCVALVFRMQMDISHSNELTASYVQWSHQAKAKVSSQEVLMLELVQLLVSFGSRTHPYHTQGTLPSISCMHTQTLLFCCPPVLSI